MEHHFLYFCFFLFNSTNAGCESLTFNHTISGGSFNSDGAGTGNTLSWMSGSTLNYHIGMDLTSTNSGGITSTYNFNVPLPISFNLLDVSASFCGSSQGEYIDVVEVYGINASGVTVYPSITVNCAGITLSGANNNILTGSDNEI